MNKKTDTFEPEYKRKARENREKYGIIEGSPGLVYTSRKTSFLLKDNELKELVISKKSHTHGVLDLSRVSKGDIWYPINYFKTWLFNHSRADTSKPLETCHQMIYANFKYRIKGKKIVFLKDEDHLKILQDFIPEKQ